MSFFEKNCYLTRILDPEEFCFGHLASFSCRFVTLALCLPRRTSSVKKKSVWNCFNNRVEWSVWGKKTFSKGTHNSTFFVRSWANQFWASDKKTWCRVVEGALYWASEPFSVEIFFWRTFAFAIFFGLRVKHPLSFGKNFLTVLSTLHSCCWKDFSQEK